MWRIGKSSEELYRSQIQSFLDIPAAFNRFRQVVPYRLIIGEPPPVQCLNFYREAMTDKDIAVNLDKFLKGDEIGRPTTWQIYGKWVSPNTTRYLNSIVLLKKEFGSLDGFRILELGAGWGGLAHCIHSQWKPASYHVIDLPEAADLAVKFNGLLGHTIAKGQPDEEVDLVIAEYSITEHDLDTLIEFTTNYILPSKRAFIRCNFPHTPEKWKWFDVLRANFDVREHRESPDHVPINSVVVCI